MFKKVFFVVCLVFCVSLFVGCGQVEPGTLASINDAVSSIGTSYKDNYFYKNDVAGADIERYDGSDGDEGIEIEFSKSFKGGIFGLSYIPDELEIIGERRKIQEIDVYYETYISGNDKFKIFKKFLDWANANNAEIEILDEDVPYLECVINNSIALTVNCSEDDPCVDIYITSMDW